MYNLRYRVITKQKFYPYLCIGYFPYKQIDLNGDKIFYTEKEIKDSVKGRDGYYVTGRVHESITKELLNLDNNPYIYVVTSNCEKPIFCTLGGRIVYYVNSKLKNFKKIKNF